MDRPLQGRRVLVTGIHDEGSLALAIARTLAGMSMPCMSADRTSTASGAVISLATW